MSPARMPWWCAPAGVVVGFLLPAMFVISLTGQMQHPALTLRGIRFLDGNFLLLGATLIVALAIGGWVGAQVQLGRPAARPDPRAWDRAALVIAVIALVAFAVWFKDFLLHPGLLIEVLTGAYRPDRKDIELTPGLTSLANTVPVFFSLYAFRLTDGAPQRPSLALHRLCMVLAVLTTFRVYVWSERLAMIEMAVPFGLALGRWLGSRQGDGWALVRNVGPYAALPLIVVFFGIAEYGRAWGSDTYQGKLGFWEFAIGRFASYYFTALNNGAGLLATAPYPTFEFEYTLEWLHRAPFGLGKLFSQAIGFHGARFDWYLQTYQDPEFNSPSGLYAVIADVGLQGGLVYMLAVGLVSGVCFRLYREGRLFGVLLHPMYFISFMEIYRYPYLGQPRAFTWTLGILLAWGVVAAAQSGSTRREGAPCA